MTYRNQIVGKKIHVVHSTNPCDLSIAGRIVDETRNMIQVKNDGLKWLIKKNIVVLLEGKQINGEELIGRPEDRIKR
ncbi:MAG: ribonuclease P protein subunit [Candidatus Methanofastidiosia archaeon]|jgi:RNase P/RNase MRP subunit p29